MDSKGNPPTEQDLLALIERFDKDKDGRITLQEFIEEMSP
jgi:Ca2+-binding EF-hand superfamily protein